MKEFSDCYFEFLEMPYMYWEGGKQDNNIDFESQEIQRLKEKSKKI